MLQLYAKENVVFSYLCLLLWQFHIVKDSENNSKQVLPPVLLVSVAICLHYLKHDC